MEVEHNKETLDEALPSIDRALRNGLESSVEIRIPNRLLNTRWLERSMDIAIHELDSDDVNLLSTFLTWAEHINYLLLKIPIGGVGATIEPTLAGLRQKVAGYLHVVPAIKQLVSFVLSSERPAPGKRLGVAPSTRALTPAVDTNADAITADSEEKT